MNNIHVVNRNWENRSGSNLLVEKMFTLLKTAKKKKKLKTKIRKVIKKSYFMMAL